ncbi:MAG TPA: hypothetical protein VMR97_01935 [Acidimicrobiales bacterium]|nr:hypothetical protein [Acidimicrobiales bacterium]
MTRPNRSTRTAGPGGARRGRRGALGVAAALTVLATVAACGGPASTPDAHPLSGPTYEVTTAKIKGLGTVLVDGKGLTLYLFVPDDHSSKSVCSGTCAVAWPPLVLPKGVSAPLAGNGVTSAFLRTTTRADGRVQVTYNGWPLYRWSADLSAGQATGQGLFNSGGPWYVVSPKGGPIRTLA